MKLSPLLTYLEAKMNHRYLLKFTAAAAACILFVCISAVAQVSTADFAGRITDQSGAAVPNITVNATHKATGQTRSAQTNSDGDFLIPSCSGRIRHNGRGPKFQQGA